MTGGGTAAVRPTHRSSACVCGSNWRRNVATLPYQLFGLGARTSCSQTCIWNWSVKDRSSVGVPMTVRHDRAGGRLRWSTGRGMRPKGRGSHRQTFCRTLGGAPQCLQKRPCPNLPVRWCGRTAKAASPAARCPAAAVRDGQQIRSLWIPAEHQSYTAVSACDRDTLGPSGEGARRPLAAWTSSSSRSSTA